MDIYSVIAVASLAGKIILENGRETYRVEETIKRISESYGISDCESFVTPTGIIISASSDYDKAISKVIRIHSRSVNLNKVNRVNSLSRDIKKEALTLQELSYRLEKIEEEKPYNKSTIVLFSSVAAGLFTLLFGGSYREFFISIIGGALIKTMSIIFSKYKVNDFFINVFGGALSAFIALCFASMGFVPSIDKIIIGSIMLLAPGLAITNAIRDTIYGDYLSGLSRGLEAFLVAVAIAIGSGTMIKLWMVL